MGRSWELLGPSLGLFLEALDLVWDGLGRVLGPSWELSGRGLGPFLEALRLP